jgi:DNA-nicking Smr family endonuclease
MTPPVKIPICDEIDLHTFRPDEVEDLLLDYFAECLDHHILQVRVVHGKGTGALKKKVQSALKRNPLVAAFHDADPAAGGWGATLVELKSNIDRAAGRGDGKSCRGM